MAISNCGKRKSLRKFFARFLAFSNKISMVQKTVLSWSWGLGNFGGLEALRPKPRTWPSRPRTSKCVLEDSISANHCNEHFSTIAQNLLNKLPNPATHYSDYLSNASRESIHLYATLPTKIKNIISGMKSKSSSGIDEILSKLLKCFNENVLFALSHIFNLSFKQEKFIKCFKIAKIISIHKTARKMNDINNYWSTSLLSSLSEVLEKLVYNRVHAFFSKHNILFEAQFGFRKHCSTSHAATMLVEKITQAFEC